MDLRPDLRPNLHPNLRSDLLSLHGPLQRGPFTIAVVGVYVLSFLSQGLLGAPVIRQSGFWPFALLQAVLIWVWYVLHARRLHDAAHSAGLAIGIACIYSLGIVLLLCIAAVLGSGETDNNAVTGGEALLAFFTVFYLLALFSADPSLGVFGYWLMGFLALLLLPVAIAFGFSIWTGTRPSVALAPSASRTP